MQGYNAWGGSTFAVVDNSLVDDDLSRSHPDFDRASVQRLKDEQETQQSWLLGGPSDKDRYLDLGCVVLSKKAVKYMALALLAISVIVAVVVLIVKLSQWSMLQVNVGWTRKPCTRNT